MSETAKSREAISHSYAPIPATTIGPLRVVWGSRTYIMAVANITPDSFSGDGLAAPSDSSDNVLDRVEQLARDAVRDGADLIDLGAESTRPGHQEISAADEIARLIPAIERLRRVLPTVALSAIPRRSRLPPLHSTQGRTCSTTSGEPARAMRCCSSLLSVA